MSKEFEDKVLAKLDAHDEKFDKIFQKLEEHDEKFDKVFQKLEEHDKKFIEHDEKFDNIFNILKEHSEDLREIKRYLIIIEDKLSNDIPALFDGYSMNAEKNRELEINQKATDKKVEINSIKISNLEKTSKKHEKNLKKLLAN